LNLKLKIENIGLPVSPGSWGIHLTPEKDGDTRPAASRYHSQFLPSAKKKLLLQYEAQPAARKTAMPHPLKWVE
jgi:hypothetical protein